MKSYNNVTMVGRIVKDCDLKEISEGNKRANFTIAVDRPYKDSEGKHPSDFLNIVAWGKLADICKDYVKKDSLILVSGRLQTRSYEIEVTHLQDGVNVGGTEIKWITEIIAESINILEYGKKDKPKDEN